MAATRPVDAPELVPPAAALRRTRRPPRAWLVVVVAALTAVAVVLATLAARAPGAPGASPGETLALLLLLGVSAFLGLEYRAAGNGNRVDLFDAALAAALVSLPGDVLTVLVVVVKAVTLPVQRVPFDKTCFNVAQWGCAVAAGSLVLALLRGEPGPTVEGDVLLLPAAMLVVAALNVAAVLLVLRRTVGRPNLGHGRRGLLLGTGIGVLANTVLGVLAAAVWVSSPQARPIVPIGLVAVHLGTRLWAMQQAGRSRLTGLQRAAATLAGPRDLASGLPRFADDLRQAFDCAGVELRLRPGPDSRTLRVAAGQDAGADRSGALLETVRRGGTAVRLAPPDGPEELLALLPEAGWRDCLVAPVRVQGEVVGVLCTHDRTGWEGFEHGELAVLESAAGVLGAAVARDRLAQVLAAERAALSASEVRWRAFARVLEQVARGTALPETLELLARTVEEQAGHGRCAVLVRTPGQPLQIAAPSLPAPAAAGLEDVVRQAFAARPSADQVSVPDLAWAEVGSAEAREALLASEVRTLSAWALPSAQDSGTTGVLVLAYTDPVAAPEDALLAAGAAKVGGLAVDHVLVQRRLAHQADHDALTDLPNRAVFLDRLRQALLSSERSASSVLVLFLDLDRFKVVNDSLGHRAGDALLCAVADRLRAAVRPGDTVARFGGDEFTMLCEDIVDEQHALRVVERLQQALERPFPLGDSELFATASIGIALGRGRAQAPETLVENADAAMYRAKDRGGHCSELFDDAMRERAVARLATSSALHRAVERREFRVVYQPTVRLSTGEVEGAEALVRWDRPGHGVVAPDAFIPLAEETGLVVPIGADVMEQACRQAARWRDAAGSAGPPTVSVNLSARQLLDPGLVPLVRGALERSQVNPAGIALEITESVLMADVTASGAVLRELKALGLSLFVDDFGTGYSSLTYLQRFPVDGVKVDRSFVAGLGREAGDAAIVRAVIGLAHSLGLVVIAEGVETQAQAAHLIDLDCDVAQGYHFGRPGPADLVHV